MGNNNTKVTVTVTVSSKSLKEQLQKGGSAIDLGGDCADIIKKYYYFE